MLFKIPLALVSYFRRDIWKTQARDLAGPRKILVRIYKTVVLSVRGFIEDKVSVRASALTLYTLLSIVPVMALLFGIAKGFGLEDKLEVWLMDQFPQQQAVLGQVMIFARRLLDDTQGGLVAGAGVAFLLYTVISVIGNIETAFNHIWTIPKSRSVGRKLTDYLSLMLIGPFLALGASGLNVYVATLVNQATKAVPLSNLFGPVATTLLGLGPIALLWALFTFLYIFLPNTKVRLISGLIGGAIAAIGYQVTQMLYIKLQVGVSHTNAIYGSFAALPLFLIWIQTSWNIVLFGAELTCINQNFESYERAEWQPTPSFRSQKRVALGISQFICKRFLGNQPAPTVESMAERFRIPNRILNEILHRLVLAEILVETASKDQADTTYLPARDPRTLTPAVIIKALDKLGEEIEGGEAEVALERFTPLLDAFDRTLENLPENKSLDDYPGLL